MNASEFIENLEDMFPLYYTHDVTNSTTLGLVTCIKRFIIYDVTFLYMIIIFFNFEENIFSRGKIYSIVSINLNGYVFVLVIYNTMVEDTYGTTYGGTTSNQPHINHAYHYGTSNIYGTNRGQSEPPRDTYDKKRDKVVIYSLNEKTLIKLKELM